MQVYMLADYPNSDAPTYRHGVTYDVDTTTGNTLVGAGAATSTIPKFTPPSGSLGVSASDVAASIAAAADPIAPKTAVAGEWVVQDDQPLHVLTGGPMDFSALRPTAVPAGSKGRVTVSGDNLVENGVTVRFNIATWAPDSGFTWIPDSFGEITAALQHLANSGYNAIRIHGIENLLLSGTDGEWAINADRLDKFDFVLSECKRLGLFWILNSMSWWLGKDMDGATDRFPAHPDGGYKSRIYTHQNIRDHWLTGMQLLYNRVNQYTGVNILQDPALLLLELYNESEVSYIGNQSGNNGFPAVWITRDVGATAAAKTWPEWLADPLQLHGYADIAALNTSWGTAHADFAAAGAAAIPANSLNGNAAGTNRSVDVGMYATYLEDNLSAFYTASVASLGIPCITAQHTSTNPTLINFRGMASLATNMVSNTHAYPFLADSGLSVGSALSKSNIPLWDSANRFIFSGSLWGAGGKPNWFGEYGFMAWGKYRAQFPLWVAALVQNNAAGVSHFSQGRFWEPTYKLLTNATTAQRFGRVYPYAGHGDPTAHFTAVMVAILQHGGVLTRLTPKTDYLTNSKTGGWSKVAGTLTRTASRASRLCGTLQRPMVYAAMLGRAQITYDPDINSTDDSYASTHLARNFKQFQGDFLPSKTITSVITSGSYGGYTASATQPIFTLTTALNDNAVTGDQLFFTNLAGSGGSWPGTTQATTACTVTVIDSTHVQVTSGVNLTGLSGFSAGTYCEASEHFKSTNINNGNIISVATTGTILGATASVTQPILELGANGGSSGNTTLVTGDEIFITNMTGTGGTWPGTGSRGATCMVTVLDATRVQVTSGLNLTGLSGANFTAGTWCEGMNVMEGRFREWGLSSRLQRAWINTKKLVAFFNGSVTTFPVAVQNVTVTALTSDASLFVAALDGLPLTTSKKMLVGMVGDAQNSGMKFSDGAARKTIADGGVYPIQMADNYAKFTVARTAYGNPKITALDLSGAKLGKARKVVVDATNMYVDVQNSASGSIFWLIEV